ncbi:HNH endonuclease [Geminocystis sp. GBBB08]|uniref:HNH endonuclease n=1 Tax=Geminocystis sp. GBBB08 TaxID=2604140 RepID=UPI0027E3B1BB|nr:HNH endonuclease [Geminocystis sp. GBBB08]MBL1209349.1 HNH endonuclease [Geminocystis sp. GBBB08]
MGKVLVLNASYEPLNITNWKRAVVLLMKGKAEQLEHEDIFLYPTFPLPSVIRLRHYVKVPYKDIPLTRKNIFERDKNTCQYCSYKGDQLTIDHVTPRSRGGADTWENLVAACVRCNIKKGNRTPKEAQMTLHKQPRKPYSSLHFEIAKCTKDNHNHEWRKYVIGI